MAQAHRHRLDFLALTNLKWPAEMLELVELIRPEFTTTPHEGSASVSDHNGEVFCTTCARYCLLDSTSMFIFAKSTTYSLWEVLVATSSLFLIISQPKLAFEAFTPRVQVTLLCGSQSMARPTLNRCDLAAWLRKVIELDGYDMPFLFGIFY